MKTTEVLWPVRADLFKPICRAGFGRKPYQIDGSKTNKRNQHLQRNLFYMYLKITFKKEKFAIQFKKNIKEKLFRKNK